MLVFEVYTFASRVIFVWVYTFELPNYYIFWVYPLEITIVFLGCILLNYLSYFLGLYFWANYHIFWVYTFELPIIFFWVYTFASLMIFFSVYTFASLIIFYWEYTLNCLSYFFRCILLNYLFYFLGVFFWIKEVFCIKDTAERGIIREQLAKIVVFISKMAERWCETFREQHGTRLQLETFNRCESVDHQTSQLSLDLLMMWQHFPSWGIYSFSFFFWWQKECRSSSVVVVVVVVVVGVVVVVA